MVNPLSPFKSTADFSAIVIPADGIADERGFYFQSTGLVKGRRGINFPQHGWRDLGLRWQAEGQKLVIYGNVGLTGYYAGPHVHIVDFYALTDAFLARLPIRVQDGWRIGHFGRNVPPAYVQSLERGRNEFFDPAFSQLYEDVTLITRGPIWSVARWRAIIRNNFID